MRMTDDSDADDDGIDDDDSIDSSADVKAVMFLHFVWFVIWLLCLIDLTLIGW